MTLNDIQKVILEEIDNIAPGNVPANLDPAADMGGAMDLAQWTCLTCLSRFTVA